MKDGKTLIRTEALLCWTLATLAWLAFAPTGQGAVREASVNEWPDVPNHHAMLSGQRVPLHRASRNELESLPGVGPVLAGRMLDARRDGRCWRNLDALTEVHGVGPHTIKNLRGYAYTGCLP